jgi:hypothetical protein
MLLLSPGIEANGHFEFPKLTRLQLSREVAVLGSFTAAAQALG